MKRLSARLERLEASRRAGKPLLHAPGISALLAAIPAREPDPASVPTPTERAFMRMHRSEIAALFQPSHARGLAGLLADARQPLEICRRLMAAELNNHV